MEKNGHICQEVIYDLLADYCSLLCECVLLFYWWNNSRETAIKGKQEIQCTKIVIDKIMPFLHTRILQNVQPGRYDTQGAGPHIRHGNKVRDSFSRYIPIADAIALLFQPYVEVVIHNIASDTVAYIANPFSGRKIGDASLLGPLDKYTAGFPYGTATEGPYENAGNKGQRMRSISAALEDDNGVIIGIMCANADFSVMEASLDVLENFLRPRNLDAPPQVLFQNDWKDNIKLEIRTFLTEKEISFEKINATHRKNLVKRLEEKNLFYARKSIEQLADILGVSRATVYNDLRLIRKNNTKGIQVLG